MIREWNIWVVGGDQRQVCLAGLLAADGHTVHTFALERAGEIPGTEEEENLAGLDLADGGVLPLPALGEDGTVNTPLSRKTLSLEAVLDRLRPGQVVCAGRVETAAREAALRRGLAIHDYFAREELAVANAVPTAEGAIQIALEELPITLHGARALVVGYGRLGRALAPRLSALGARVSVAARKWEDLAWIEAAGYTAEHTGELEGWLCGCDLIVNTVPARVLDEGALRDLKPGCLIIDLASKPGGVDFEAARTLGVRAVWALSLPGKTAPVTAGQAVKSSIYHILNELGV